MKWTCRRHWTVVALLALSVSSLGMMGDGCNATGPDTTTLAGTWAISRGQTDVTITWQANAADGTVTEDSTTSTLGELDPADFPVELADLVAQWNAGLAELNANLDEALPDNVIVTFPGAFQMRITDADNAANTGTGVINDQDVYFFLGDVSGAGAGSDQGGGAVLDAASIEGGFDRDALTTTGQVTRRLIVLLAGANNDSLSLVVEIDVNYTGTRTGDVPTDFVEPPVDNVNTNDNADNTNDNADNANDNNDANENETP